MTVWIVLLGACGRAEEAPPVEPVAPVGVVEEPQPEPIPAEGAFSREIAPGLTLAAYDPPAIDDPGFSDPVGDLSGCDPRLFVVTIDPDGYRLDYAHGWAPGAGAAPLTGPEWAEKLDADVVFNPGMFEPDRRATGYTRGSGFTSQPEVRRSGMYRGWFVADPSARVLDVVPPKGSGSYGAYDDLAPEVRARLDGYGIVTQSLSILRDGKPVYPARDKQWSELAFGADDRGRIVVVFSRWPYEMREFGARVAALGLGITDLVHGEGGPEATLTIRAGGLSWTAVGSYETDFADDSNDRAWGLPAVFAAIPR